MKQDMKNNLRKFSLLFAAAIFVTACGDDGDDDNSGTNPGTSDETTEINGTEILATNDMYGLVSDATTGAGIAGVNVTDGYTWTTTDANGVYQFNGDEVHARDIYISVPANYKVPVDGNNFPKFYSSNVNREGNSRNDFELEPQTVQENFTLVMIGDPQCKTEEQVNRFKNETLADITSTISSGDYENVYGFTLGDITFDNTVEWDPMVTAMSNVSVGSGYMPFFQCVGNHDHDASQNTDYAALNNYISRFGPTDYSVNIGKAHIIVMDDVIGTSTSGKTWDYVGGLTAVQYKWLAKDIELVSDKEDKLVIFCAHIPFRAGGGVASSTDGSNVNKDRYYSQVLSLLSEFKEAHIMIGHTHYTQNYVHTEKTAAGGLPIYEHIHGAACGAWWNSNSTVTGEPNGYTIYKVEGNQIVDWQLKGTNQDADFQMRVFDGNQIYPGTYPLNWYTKSQKAGSAGITVKGNALTKGCFVADVFNDDDTYWTVELYKNGAKVGDFTRLANGSMCNVAAAAYYFNALSKNTSTWASTTASHYWYCAAPSGYPAGETGWEVVATQTIPSSGTTHTYTCSTLQTDYTGF
jgi:hypothetical protein